MFYRYGDQVIQTGHANLDVEEERIIRKMTAEFSYQGGDALRSAKELLGQIRPENRRVAMAMVSKGVVSA